MKLIFENELAKRLDLSPYMIRRLRERLSLPHIRISEKVVMYDAEKIEKVLNKLEARV